MHPINAGFIGFIGLFHFIEKLDALYDVSFTIADVGLNGYFPFTGKWQLACLKMRCMYITGEY